ncbi:adenylate kinase [Synechococcales cyanobacterium C]|uniref:Adenylate kinase n=1 Tax=Petrachloros mirabilis ULC683 TaxID=2781853 RepID=A0A8K2A1E1_9CYAN|nr:adenylate kinase [Petrachloros mirabilis ULC683]
MARLVLFGPPGAGKGTQATALSKILNLIHISTGDLFRAAVAQKTALGIQAQQYLDKGELVPDEVVIGMVRERLGRGDTHSGWILDGFPRTIPQAKALESLLIEIDQRLDQVINLKVSDDVLVARLLSRGRQDDTEAVIRRRLQVYAEQTQPLIQFYQERQQLINIDGNQSMAQVTQAIEQAVTLLDHSL